MFFLPLAIFCIFVTLALVPRILLCKIAFLIVNAFKSYGISSFLCIGGILLPQFMRGYLSLDHLLDVLYSLKFSITFYIKDIYHFSMFAPVFDSCHSHCVRLLLTIDLLFPKTFFCALKHLMMFLKYLWTVCLFYINIIRLASLNYHAFFSLAFSYPKLSRFDPS